MPTGDLLLSWKSSFQEGFYCSSCISLNVFEYIIYYPWLCEAKRKANALFEIPVAHREGTSVWVSVSMCMHNHTQTQICSIKIYTPLSSCMHIHKHLYASMYTYKHIYKCIFTHACTHSHVHTYVCTCSDTHMKT